MVESGTDDPAGGARAAGATLRILLVDDNLDHARLAMRALRAEPAWHVDLARLGQESLLQYAASRHDLVLLDYRLPDMTGLDVLDRLLAHDADAQVILMTSQGSEEVAMAALDRGAAGYVVKDQDFGKRLVFEVRGWIEERGGP